MRRLALLTAVLTLCVAASAVAATGQIEPRIVGGTSVTTTGEYPWQVGLMAYNGGGQYCGGTLVAPRFVVTADHCDVRTTEYVHAGSHDISAGGEYIKVKAVRRHPLADARDTSRPARYDVDVVELEQPVSVANAAPLAIAAPSESALWAVNASLTITGWGHLHETDTTSPATLQVARVPRRADTICASAYPGEFFTIDQFCASPSGGGTDTCQGDSGGPIVAAVNGSPTTSDPKVPAQWRLVGATSYGTGCARAAYPGVYARLSDSAIYDFVDTAAAVPGTATLSGTPAVGSTLTCATTGWTGGRSYRRWRFVRDGVAGAIQDAPTTTVAAGDAGRTIACAAIGDNGAGQTATAASAGLAVPGGDATPAPADPAPATTTTPAAPVAPAPLPAPSPAPAPAPAPAAAPVVVSTPRTSVGKITRSCKRRRCTFTIRSTARTLKLTLRRGATTATILKARRGRNGTFTVTTGTLRKGRYVVTVTGATTAKRLTFSV